MDNSREPIEHFDCPTLNRAFEEKCTQEEHSVAASLCVPSASGRSDGNRCMNVAVMRVDKAAI